MKALAVICIENIAESFDHISLKIVLLQVKVIESYTLDDFEALACFAFLDRLSFSQYSESSGLVASKTALASGVEVIILNKLSRY